MLTPNQARAITSAEPETLRRWACVLNCFEWPVDFPLAEPDWYAAATPREKYENAEADEIIRLVWQYAGDWNAYWRGPFDCGRNRELLQKLYAPTLATLQRDQ